MVVQEFDLNLIPSSAPVIIHVDQYDKGDNRLLIHLYDGDTPYVPETAATVEIQGVKPDTKGFQYYADIDGSTVTADVVMQMTACAGRVKTQIVVTETTGRTGTFDFILDVQESALPAIVDISETELPIIIEGAQAQADAAAASAAQAAASEQLAAEHIVVTAENANRAESEADRAEAEADRAETSREIAEDAEAWAIGERGGVPVEEGDETYENNSKWYSEQIQNEKEDAEAWAKGTRNGEPVSEDDPAYHNNSKYWSDKSGTSRLVSLDDVVVANVQNDDLLHYDEESEKWVNERLSIEKLGDVAIRNVQDGEALVYDEIKGKWVNKVASTHYVTVPTVTGLSFTYDGTEQGPTITGLDPDWDNYITITEATATDAGEYTLRFSLRNTQLYVWNNLSTQDITYEWKIEKDAITVPTVTANLTYNGSAQSPTITGFDSSTMYKYGDSETNAGDYYVTFELKDPYNTMWTDESSEEKQLPWSIAKATGAITLSDDEVTLDADHLTATVTFSGATGTVSVSSSDTTVATATVAGSVITISSVNDTTGTATITVSVAASENYLATSKTITARAAFTNIYGVEWDGTSSSTMSRTDGAADFVDPSPAVANGNGSSPFDNLMPWSGMQRVTDANGGVLVKIPKFWFKLQINDTTGAFKLQIADGPTEGFSVSPAHMDRGDGAGERDFVYVGAYHCSSSDYKSTSGVSPKARITRANFRTAIHNLGSDIWQWDKAMLETIQMLYLVEYADWNSQAKIGYGCSDRGSVQNSGLCDAMVYHTGTNAANRTTYGHVRYRYIEDLWANVYDWLDGIYLSSGKAYVILNPANFSDTTGGVYDGFSATLSSSEIKRFKKSGVSGLEWFYWPVETISNSVYDTYICDNGSAGSSYVVVFVGGSFSQFQSHGLFYQSSFSVSNSSSDFGSRLQKLPAA